CPASNGNARQGETQRETRDNPTRDIGDVSLPPLYLRSTSAPSRTSDSVIAFIVDNRMEGKNIRDKNKYRASVEADVRNEIDVDRLDRIIPLHDPDTPIEMFAALALGEPVPYLRHYRLERNEDGAA